MVVACRAVVPARAHRPPVEKRNACRDGDRRLARLAELVAELVVDGERKARLGPLQDVSRDHVVERTSYQPLAGLPTVELKSWRKASGQFQDRAGDKGRSERE